MKGLKDKIVIISGGSRGIGRACCIEFAKYGAKVIFTYNKSKEEAEKLSQYLLEELKTEVLSIQSDVSDYEQCKNVVKTALEKFGRIDVLINNAGILRDKALMLMTQQEWQDVINTNLGGVFNMTRAAIVTFLKQKSGCILNISSVSGLHGISRQTNYSAAKAGIIGFSKALAKEVSPYNVRVNVICPGFIDTDMVGSLNENLKKEILNTIPIKRFGRPEEVAALCAFLASDDAQYIIGEVIRIDGGLAI
ncbi:MAG: 3-oxoacyl-[acyl-carrier-protein] reductase [Candidatus Omnitrophica bacterium]|nr:3-oxoacyl-[acyl-carrier-protein] reductase [Candidatus Omnitrophota bacterium]MCM8831210.1 3-oxoacyl-[acyl-carrier-protein] reductase [Candidatus Omnitrophota bacterium]